MASAPRMQRFVTVTEAARTLEVDQTTIRRWRAAGRVRGVRAGKFYLIRASDVRALAAGLAAKCAAHEGADTEH